jgi:hypothetical protein
MSFQPEVRKPEAFCAGQCLTLMIRLTDSLDAAHFRLIAAA